jgi:iron-sulfur cluster assembly protein
LSFAVTHRAARAIRALIVERDPASGAGFRISRTATPPGSLLLSVVPGPEEDDHVLSFDGAVVFIEAEAGHGLGGKVLDVEVNPQGVALFSLAPDAPGRDRWFGPPPPASWR